MPLPVAAVGGGGFAGGLCMAGIAKMLTGNSAESSSSSSKAANANAPTSPSSKRKPGDFPNPFEGIPTEKKKAEGKVSSR